MLTSFVRPSSRVLKSLTARSGVTSFRIASSTIHTGKFVLYTKPEEEPLPPSLTEKYKLYEPTRWVPLTAAFFGITTATGIYHWDAESQMMGLFIVFVSLAYTQVGPSIGQYFEDESNGIIAELREAEERNMSSVKDDLAHSQKYVNYDADIQALVDAQKQLELDLREAVPLSFQERKNAFFQSKLDRIVAIETEARESLQSTLISKATDSVKSAFTNEKSLQDKSLQTALAWLQAEEGNKKELTEVGDQFRAFFAEAKTDPNVTKDIETKMKANIDRVLAEKFEVVDEYQYLKSAN